jgi:glycosyltransferase involved in cell wall biosynthesis
MFDFIKYIQPANYYRLLRIMPHSVLTDKISKQELLTQYKDADSIKIDSLYYLLQSGEIPDSSQARNNLQSRIVYNTHDNYMFIRRYFSLPQVVYVFFLRLLSFKNPIVEIWYFSYVLLKVKRVKIIRKDIPEWNSFQSKLLQQKPFISVIIPTLNRYTYLKDVLSDLENQSFKNFEIIVVDQSEPLDYSFYRNWNLDIQLIQQEEKALWLARNSAIKVSKGDYILLFDDDSRVEEDWIENHLKCIDFFSNKISAGVTETLVGGGLGNKDGYFHLSDVFDTGNAMVERSVFNNIGLFDRQFEKQRMGDSEFGIRALLGGISIISNPYAKRIHLKVETGGLRQMGSWDAVRPESLFSPRPVPSVLYLIRKYHGNKEAFLYLIKHIPQSFMPYKYKGNKLLRISFALTFPLFLPLAVIAVSKSWAQSSLKLKNGSIIS